MARLATAILLTSLYPVTLFDSISTNVKDKTHKLSSFNTDLLQVGQQGEKGSPMGRRKPENFKGKCKDKEAKNGAHTYDKAR